MRSVTKKSDLPLRNSNSVKLQILCSRSRTFLTQKNDLTPSLRDLLWDQTKFLNTLDPNELFEPLSCRPYSFSIHPNKFHSIFLELIAIEFFDLKFLIIKANPGISKNQFILDNLFETGQNPIWCLKLCSACHLMVRVA